METNEFEKYYLGDGEHYFKYRRDKYNQESCRATLFNSKGEKIDDICTDNLTHHQVINRFEVRVMS